MMKSKFLKTGFLIGLLLGVSVPALGLISEQDRAKVEKVRNYASNPGFEGRTVGWTPSGSSTLTILSGSSALEGSLSGQWDPSATSELLSGVAVTVPEGLKGNQCSVEMRYKWTSGVSGEIELQAYDGSNPLVQLPLEPTTSNVPAQPAVAIFPCPSSGTIQWRLASTADAAAIDIDQVHLGEPTRKVEVGQTELIAKGYFAANTNCQWPNSGTSYDNFGTDSDCPGPTFEHVSVPNTSTDTDLPRWELELPPGNYMITYRAPLLNNTANETSCTRLSDGTSSSGDSCIRTNDGATNLLGVTGIAYFNYLVSGTRTFTVQGACSGASTCGIWNDTAFTDKSRLEFEIVRYPLSTQSTLSFDKANWRVDVNIGGATVGISTGNQSSYIGATDSSLDMVLRTGSVAAQIPCSTTNPPTGLTCAAGDESVGVSFTIPYAGKYKVCGEFIHGFDLDASSALSTTFQWVETPNNAQTISQEGGSRMNDRLDSNSGISETHARPLHVCGEFTFTSSGQKTLRLFHENSSTGTINSNSIIADRNASDGQRDMRITVEPVTKFQGGITFENLISSTAQSGMTQATALVDGNGTPSVSSQDGSWIDSIDDNGTGDWDLNFVAGVFANQPRCFIIPETSNFCGQADVNGTTDVNILIKDCDSAANPRDGVFQVLCISQK